MGPIGVLALQGGFAAHERSLARVGASPVEIRRVAELADVDALVLPGGESTTLLNLMQDEPWFAALRDFHERGGALLGTCAGAILLSREVARPPQPSLGLLDVAVVRNAYGRQVDSFEESLQVAGLDHPLRAVFIRAPRFRHCGPGVEVLAERAGEAVLVRQGTILAATFHPELTEDSGLHRMFLHIIEESVSEPKRSPGNRAAVAGIL